MSRLAIAFAALLMLAARGAPSADEIISKCPELTKSLMSEHGLTPSSFTTTYTNVAASSAKGTANLADRREVAWQCGQGIAKAGKVNIWVGTADTRSTLLNEYVEVT